MRVPESVNAGRCLGFFCGLMLALLALESVAAEDIDYPFGRLFTAAEQRQGLDVIKRGGAAVAAPIENRVTIEPGPKLDAKANSVRFSGYVRRADGSIVLWVDGSTDLSGNSDSEYSRQLNNEDDEALFVSSDQQMRLRVGQTWIVEEETVVEVYRETGLVDDIVESADGTLNQALDKAQLPASIDLGSAAAAMLQEGLNQSAQSQ